MNDILEVVVNGHSGHESTGFNLPNGFAIRFYADDRTTCYVPSTHVATVVNELRAGAGELKNSGNIVNNYMIQFDPNDSTEGVFDMNGNNLNVGESIGLKNLIQGLRNQFPTKNIIIYAIFCRGSARENFANQVAPVSEHVGQQALLNEEPLDFDMDFDMGGGKKRKTKRRRTKRRKKRRRRKTKRRVKRRRKTTRKKRGRGISPSRMAKGAVGVLAASEMMKQGSAVVSPQGRAVQQQLRSVNCDTIAGQGRQLIKPLHPDHGGTDEDFRAAYGTLTHRRGQCKLNRQRGDTGQDSKPKPKRRDGESAKKARQRENRERRAKKAKQQEEQAKAKARTERQQEADARAGRTAKKSTTSGNFTKAASMGAAVLGGLAVGQMLGKKDDNEPKPGVHRLDFGDGMGVRRFQGPYDKQSRGRKRYYDPHSNMYFRELTPEGRKPGKGPVYSNFAGAKAPGYD